MMQVLVPLCLLISPSGERTPTEDGHPSTPGKAEVESVDYTSLASESNVPEGLAASLDAVSDAIREYGPRFPSDEQLAQQWQSWYLLTEKALPRLHARIVETGLSLDCDQSAAALRSYWGVGVALAARIRTYKYPPDYALGPMIDALHHSRDAIRLEDVDPDLLEVLCGHGKFRLDEAGRAKWEELTAEIASAKVSAFEAASQPAPRPLAGVHRAAVLVSALAESDGFVVDMASLEAKVAKLSRQLRLLREIVKLGGRERLVNGERAGKLLYRVADELEDLHPGSEILLKFRGEERERKKNARASVDLSPDSQEVAADRPVTLLAAVGGPGPNGPVGGMHFVGEALDEYYVQGREARGIPHDHHEAHLERRAIMDFHREQARANYIWKEHVEKNSSERLSPVESFRHEAAMSGEAQEPRPTGTTEK